MTTIKKFCFNKKPSPNKNLNQTLIICNNGIVTSIKYYFDVYNIVLLLFCCVFIFLIYLFNSLNKNIFSSITLTTDHC